MSNFIKGTAFLLGIAVTMVAQAASFDCSVARSPVEKAICASKELSAADDAMATLYKSVLVAVPADAQAGVRSDQRIWLRNVGLACGKDIGAAITKCVQDMYSVQMDELKKRVMTMGGVRFVARSVELKSKDTPDDPWKSEEDQKLEANPGFGTLTAKWPQALSDAPEWKAWNAAVLAATQKTAGEDKPGGKWDDALAEGTETEVIATLEQAGPQVVSISLSSNVMGHGAAHPSEDYEEFHWMLAEKRPLKAADVFQPGSAWEKVIAARCRASLRKQIGADYESYASDFAKTLAGIVGSSANWTIDKNGIGISFPEYSVTPRVEPVDPVRVPWTVLEPYRNKGFVIPR